jgi:hypothetical protein
MSSRFLQWRENCRGWTASSPSVITESKDGEPATYEKRRIRVRVRTSRTELLEIGNETLKRGDRSDRSHLVEAVKDSR